ncbi:hypothetical protein ACTND9_23990, partial [Paenibacillus barengoltzii]
VIYYVLGVIVAFFVQLGRLSSVGSNLTLIQAITLYDFIFLSLLIFPLYEILVHNQKIFIKNIVILVFLALLMRLSIWVLYNFTAVRFTNYIIHSENWTRPVFGKLFMRVNNTCLDGLAFVYLAKNLLIDKKNKILSIFGILFMYLYVIFVSQFRMQLIAFTLILLVFAYKSALKSSKKYLNTFFLLSFICIAILALSNKLGSFFNTFSTTNISYGGSTQTRLLGIDYLFNRWKAINPWLGIGFIANEVEVIEGTYWLSDYGFLIAIVQYGIVGGIIQVIPFIVGIIDSIKRFYKKNTVYEIGLTIYLLIVGISFNLLENTNYIVIPLYIAFILYSSNERIRE